MQVLRWIALAAALLAVVVAVAFTLDMHRAYERVLARGTVIPSALLFGVLYPERVASMTLISCGVVAVETDDQAAANDKGDMLVKIFEHDFLYWAASKILKKPLMGLIGASDEVVAGLSSEQLRLFERFPITLLNYTPASVVSCRTGVATSALIKSRPLSMLLRKASP